MAKRYKINIAERANNKTGIKWRYRGKTENWKKVVDDWEFGITRYTREIAIRITDCVTGEKVCEVNRY